MKKVMEKKTDRDEKLIADYKSNDFDMSELVGRYKISSTRIYQILDYYQIPRKGKYARYTKKQS